MQEQEKAHAASGIEVETPPWVVAAGNPFDGIKLYGPFEDAEVAGDWAERNVTEDWWSVKVETVLYTFVIRSNMGERNWQAEDEPHAREQHHDAFANERIISVRKLIQ